MLGKAVWTRSLVAVGLVVFGVASAQAQPKMHASSQK